MRLDDEHARIHGKGGTVRTVLLDDCGYVALLKLYLARAGYTAGPLFRASINGTGGPLSYDAAHHRWTSYCAAAGVDIDIHQLRHAHVTELINAGVSIEAVRRRLGHASTETTQLYALLDGKLVDAMGVSRLYRQNLSTSSLVLLVTSADRGHGGRRDGVHAGQGVAGRLGRVVDELMFNRCS